MTSACKLYFHKTMNLTFRWLALSFLLYIPNSFAHKASDAYLQLKGSAGLVTELRVDVALRDLNAALDLDANGDAQLTWGEIRLAWPAIESYIRSGVQLQGCDDLKSSQPLLERRIDGVYAALVLSSKCQPVAAPVIRYQLFAEVDPTHRGIASTSWRGQTVTVQVLDPKQSVNAEQTEATGEESGFWQFIMEGIRHIVTGYDHVLFLICLLLPAVMHRSAQGWKPVERFSQAVIPVVGIVTAFTVAHSITLALAATQTLAFPSEYIEPAIAVTIMLAAFNNIKPIFGGRTILITFIFGLIHGFGFAGVLAELKLPTAQFFWALLQFNVGLELGQLLIVAVITTLLFQLRHSAKYPTWIIKGGSVIAMAIGALWLLERTTGFAVLPF
jgi:hypothetical protein